MKTKKFFIGCGISALVVAICILIVTYFGWKTFVNYGVSSDLIEYRETIKGIEMDPEIRTQLISNIERIRLSLDKRNNITFFKWLEIDESIVATIGDGKVDKDELTSLHVDIQRMIEIQNLSSERNVEPVN